ncbi:MAG: thioredoxin fold domain-containing protein [Fimbriimonadaceae bacterium]|nr:MAG: thioredoxin fold domain-containing protein [Fimbriimonadaceae bacterium]
MSRALFLVAALVLAFGCASNPETSDAKSAQLGEPVTSTFGEKPEAAPEGTVSGGAATSSEKNAAEAQKSPEGDKPVAKAEGGATKTQPAGTAEKGKPVHALIKTAPTMEAALKQVSSDGVVLLKFEADWCAPCQLMKREAFQDQEVVDRLKNTVVVLIDADDEKNNEVQQKFQVANLPTLVFLDKSGHEFARMLGYNDLSWFRSELIKAMAKKGA